jgi:microcystin-dependent protein
MIRLIEILASGVTDDSAAVLASGTVTSYLAGTTTLETIYEDFTLTDPHSNPLTLSASGRAVAYSNKRLKLVFRNAAGTVVRTIDNVGTNDTDVPASTSQAIPAGSILGYGGSSAPTGWLACDGSAVSRTTYATLFAAISTIYGVGDSSTTFNLPDGLGRAMVGDGSGASLTTRTRGDEFGVEEVTLSAIQSGIAAHTHGVTDAGHTHAQKYSTGAGAVVDSSALLASAGVVSGGNTASNTTGITINNASATAAASAHTNLQPSFVAKYIIKT